MEKTNSTLCGGRKFNSRLAPSSFTYSSVKLTTSEIRHELYVTSLSFLHSLIRLDVNNGNEKPLQRCLPEILARREVPIFFTLLTQCQYRLKK